MKLKVLILLVMLPYIVAAEEFVFQYTQGDQYKVLGEVDQEIYYDGELVGKGKIQNKISFSVQEVSEGSGLLRGNFYVFTSTDSRSSSFVPVTLENIYPTEFWRDSKGRMRIDDQYLMPVVRNVPVFPEGEISPGQSWTNPAIEVHDMRESFGSTVPIKVPMQVNYTYNGKTREGDLELDVFSIEYTIFSPINLGLPQTVVQPRRITGYSKQRLLWDNVAGRPHSYSEEYALILYLNTGNVYEFRGTASSAFTEVPPLDRRVLRERIEEELEESGLNDITVTDNELGITLTWDSLNFYPNSSELLPGEETKLAQIARILSEIPGRDVLVEGHTALAGTVEGRQQLSEERASVIGEYFLRQGIRRPGEIIIQGHGAQRPVASNSTEAGMRANRRVEITVLEN
jgi:outer membrane protein OmpA-like peptidoglycan-associated protein